MKRKKLWIKDFNEEELCPECLRVVGVPNRYKLVCILGKAHNGLTVTGMTGKIRLTQPTVTHHLNISKSVEVVSVQAKGRNRIYTLNRNAHCFDECNIPY